MARSICFYTDSRELGGAENAMLMLLGSLDRAAWEPQLLLTREEGADPLAVQAESLAVAVRRVEPLPLGLSGARGVPAMARQLRAARPQLFHSHMSSPMSSKWGNAAAILAGVPTIGTVQLVPSYEPTRSARLQLRALASRVDRFIAVSRAIAAELGGRFGWPAEKIEVIHNAVDLRRFGEARPAAREELATPTSGPIVLTSARLTDQKGIHFLLRALAKADGVALAIAGDGPLRSELEGEAERLEIDDRVSFLGHRDDVPELLAACDVFALPSLFEGSSLAVLEAMAAGAPVVSSAIGGTAEVVEDGRSGLLVPPEDPEALAAALRRLAADETLRARLSAAARERVESEFAREVMARRVEAAYERVLGR